MKLARIGQAGVIMGVGNIKILNIVMTKNNRR
jgi:hypothetical protein